MNRLTGITRPGAVPITNPGEHCALGLQNEVIIDLVGPGGVIKDHRHLYGNILTTFGLNNLEELIASGTKAASTWIHCAGIGTVNTAPASTDVALGGSIATNSGGIVFLSQASMTRSDSGNRTLNYHMTFDGNAATTVAEIGLGCTNAMSVSVAARRTFGDINKASNDTINATYKIIFGSA